MLLLYRFVGCKLRMECSQLVATTPSLTVGLLTERIVSNREKATNQREEKKRTVSLQPKISLSFSYSLNIMF